MPQISIYVTKKEHEYIMNAAQSAGISASKYVVSKLFPKSGTAYDREFISLFGSLSEDSLVLPERGDFSDDSPREAL